MAFEYNALEIMGKQLYTGSMPARENEPLPIANLIDKWFQEKNYCQKRLNYSAFNRWNEIVGPDIAKNTEPVKFYDDVLVIRVKNSVWTQELQYLKPQLLEKIRASFPETKIRDLMFKVGRLRSPETF